MNKFILIGAASIAYLFTPAAPATAGVVVDLGGTRVVVGDNNRNRYNNDRNYRNERDREIAREQYRREQIRREHDRREHYHDHNNGPRTYRHY